MSDTDWDEISIKFGRSQIVVGNIYPTQAPSWVAYHRNKRLGQFYSYSAAVAAILKREAAVLDAVSDITKESE